MVEHLKSSLPLPVQSSSLSHTHACTTSAMSVFLHNSVATLRTPHCAHSPPLPMLSIPTHNQGNGHVFPQHDSNAAHTHTHTHTHTHAHTHTHNRTTLHSLTPTAHAVLQLGPYARTHDYGGERISPIHDSNATHTHNRTTLHSLTPTAHAVLQLGPYARTTSAMSVLLTTTSRSMPVPRTCICCHKNLSVV
jgi:hypothetical protein